MGLDDRDCGGEVGGLKYSATGIWFSSQEVESGCGQMWTVVDGCGRLLAGVGRCGGIGEGGGVAFGNDARFCRCLIVAHVDQLSSGVEGIAVLRNAVDAAPLSEAKRRMLLRKGTPRGPPWVSSNPAKRLVCMIAAVGSIRLASYA